MFLNPSRVHYTIAIQPTTLSEVYNNTKSLVGTARKRLRPLKRGGRLIEVSFTVND